MEAKDALDNVIKAISEKQAELKELSEKVANLEKDIIFLSGQKSILESIQIKDAEVEKVE